MTEDNNDMKTHEELKLNRIANSPVESNDYTQKLSDQETKHQNPYFSRYTQKLV